MRPPQDQDGEKDNQGEGVTCPACGHQWTP